MMSKISWIDEEFVEVVMIQIITIALVCYIFCKSTTQGIPGHILTGLLLDS